VRSEFEDALYVVIVTSRVERCSRYGEISVASPERKLLLGIIYYQLKETLVRGILLV